MSTSPAIASAITIVPTATTERVSKPNEAATRIYQVVTIAAMFLLLCSLWVF